MKTIFLLVSEHDRIITPIRAYENKERAGIDLQLVRDADKYGSSEYKVIEVLKVE